MLYEVITVDLELMRKLAELRIACRHQRGSLDFDLPEAQIVLDLQGRPENIVRAERNLAHRLIEEFMLAANEAVADFLTRNEWGLLYRIHEEPDLQKLQELQQLAAECGVGLVLGKHLQKAS